MLFSKAGAKVTFFRINFNIFLKKTCKISRKKPIFAPGNGAVKMFQILSSTSCYFTPVPFLHYTVLFFKSILCL